MYLKTVFVRFYKSFNFDYLRKYHASAEPDDWEQIDSMWYPYVRIPIDRKITTIVGENESGKTHLLTAIEKGLSGNDIELKDFCRYSRFFTVEEDKMRLPDFGFEWAGLSDEEMRTVSQACKVDLPGDWFILFRTEGENLTVYTPGSHRATLEEKDQDKVLGILPSVFRLHTNIKLPETVPIRSLLTSESSACTFEWLQRNSRTDLVEDVMTWNSSWFSTPETIKSAAPQIQGALSKIRRNKGTNSDDEEKAELELARNLIRKIARIDIGALRGLQRALRSGDDAFANSLIQKINEALADNLNFPKWWVQDSEFELKVSARDCDLAFTISDRTKREYSFGERSSGLRYFLSYYIQYRSHQPMDARPEILLMDEPDAYLSSQGQQDLLKIFDAFAEPTTDKNPTQVIYVTHSPFLIDKNHAERIRVLQKGEGDEGTRVVRDASRNHYEPLRSSFGSFVAETTFIGNCNLMTEGVADQVLLAGASVYLRARHGIPRDLETLDLNHLTIVPASGASHIPYLVYLARGRDVEQPAIIVFLDSDTDGNNAKRGILKGGLGKRSLLDENFILQVGELADCVTISKGPSLVETEDLIPLEICATAASRYLNDVCGFEEEECVVAAAIAKKLKHERTTFKAIQACVGELDGNPHIEKLPFARSVIDSVRQMSRNSELEPELSKALQIFESNMRAVFRRLNHMRRQALREHNVERVSKRVKREKNSFLKDHPFEARRSDVLLLFEDICTVLKETSESDEIRFEIARLRREFKIDEDVTELVDEYEKFKQRLEHLTYVGVLSAQEKPLGNDGNDRDRDEGESKTAAEPVATTKSKAET